MKRLHLGWAAVCLSFLLAGCGTQVPLSGKAFDDYMESIKPALHYWVKEGMTEESKSRDSVGCGGSVGGTDFSNQKISAARREGENDSVVRSRLTDDWRRCMIEKGYRRTDSR